MRGYTTISQSKKLMELGLSPDTADMNWFILPDTVNPVWVVRTFPYINDGAIEGNLPCWSLEALLSLMPIIDGIMPTSRWNDKFCIIKYTGLFLVQSQTRLDAAYSMVCKLLENGHIKTE